MARQIRLCLDASLCKLEAEAVVYSELPQLLLTRVCCRLLNWEDADDGVFWMSCVDFLRRYRTVYVCRVFTSSKWQEVLLHGEWKGSTAAGSTEHRDGAAPQYLLSVQKPCHVIVVLTQEDSRGTNREAHHIGLMLYDKGGKRSSRNIHSKLSSGAFVNKRAVLLESTTLERSDSGSPYTLVASTFKPGKEATFTVHLWANRSGVKLVPLAVDAPDSDANYCGGCGQRIDGTFLTAEGLNWHSECWLCTNCHQRLDAKYYTRGGGTLCQACNQRAEDRSAPKCGGCRRPLRGERLTYDGVSYHGNCFKCTSCRAILGETVFIDGKTKQPICRNCA